MKFWYLGITGFIALGLGIIIPLYLNEQKGYNKAIQRYAYSLNIFNTLYYEIGSYYERHNSYPISINELSEDEKFVLELNKFRSEGGGISDVLYFADGLKSSLDDVIIMARKDNETSSWFLFTNNKNCIEIQASDDVPENLKLIIERKKIAGSNILNVLNQQTSNLDAEN